MSPLQCDDGRWRYHDCNCGGCYYNGRDYYEGQVVKGCYDNWCEINLVKFRFKLKRSSSFRRSGCTCRTCECDGGYLIRRSCCYSTTNDYSLYKKSREEQKK